MRSVMFLLLSSSFFSSDFIQINHYESNAVPILSLRGEAKMKLTRDKRLLDNSNHTRCEIKLISRNILDSVDRYEPIKILGNIDEHRRVFEFSKGRVEPF